jgi:hypothetical protein
VRGRHWFLFVDQEGGTRCDSVEDLSGPTAALSGPFFPTWRFRELTRQFLRDLKSGAERRAASRRRLPGAGSASCDAIESGWHAA